MAARVPFSHREKVAAEQPDEGLRCWRLAQVWRPRSPSPVAFGDTLSLWERGAHRRRFSSASTDPFLLRLGAAAPDEADHPALRHRLHGVRPERHEAGAAGVAHRGIDDAVVAVRRAPFRQAHCPADSRLRDRDAGTAAAGSTSRRSTNSPAKLANSSAYSTVALKSPTRSSSRHEMVTSPRRCRSPRRARRTRRRGRDR